jgi:hypothetical protein
MHQLRWSFDDLLFVLAVIIVSVSLTVTWWRFRDTRYPQMSTWRRLALRFGLFGNTASLVLLLSFIALSLFQQQAMLAQANLRLAFSFVFWVVFSSVTVLCGIFGRGGARVLVMTNCVLLTSLWYLLGLANSL